MGGRCICGWIPRRRSVYSTLKPRFKVPVQEPGKWKKQAIISVSHLTENSLSLATLLHLNLHLVFIAASKYLRRWKQDFYESQDVTYQWIFPLLEQPSHKPAMFRNLPVISKICDDMLELMLGLSLSIYISQFNMNTLLSCTDKKSNWICWGFSIVMFVI